MYTLVSAILRKMGRNSRYESVDLSRTRMSELFSTYRDGYVELANSSLKDHVFVTLDELKTSQRYVYTNGYFPDWLVAQGNLTIYGTINKPTIVGASFSFSDIIQAGFTMKRVAPSDIEGKNTYPLDMMTDIYIRKIVTEENLLTNYALPIVNGYAHLPIPRGNGLLLKGAGGTVDVTEDCHVGVLSFENIGKLTYVPLNVSTVKMDKIHPPRKGVYVTLDMDLRGKTPILSFAGRLFLNHDMVSIINAELGVLRLHLEKLDFLKLIQESLNHLDLSSLKLDEHIYRTGSLNNETAQSDEVVTALLYLIQSFIVVVDNANVIYNTELMSAPRITGCYEMYVPTKLPYIDDNGLLHPYWKQTHPGYYNTTHRIHLKDTVYRPAIVDTGLDYLTPHWLNDNYAFTGRVQYHKGRLVDLRYEKMIFK